MRIFVGRNSSIVTTIYSNVVAITNETTNIARPMIFLIVLEIVLSDVSINNNDRMMREVTINQNSISRSKKVELTNVDWGDECMICWASFQQGCH